MRLHLEADTKLCMGYPFYWCCRQPRLLAFGMQCQIPNTEVAAARLQESRVPGSSANLVPFGRGMKSGGLRNVVDRDFLESREAFDHVSGPSQWTDGRM